MVKRDKKQEATRGGVASNTGDGDALSSNPSCAPYSQYNVNPPDEQVWRPRPGPGEGWRKPSRWLVRKRMESLREAFSHIRRVPPTEPDLVHFSITLNVETSQVAYDMLRYALERVGVRFQLKIAISQTIETLLESWGFPVLGIYRVVSGTLSVSDGEGDAEGVGSDSK